MDDKTKKLPAVVESKDELVDGAAIAARILNHMPAANRERLMHAIGESNAEAAARIQEKLLRFDDLADIPVQGMQLLLQQIDPKDLVVSLKTASLPVKQAIFRGMSERRRKIVEDDFLALPRLSLADVEAAQRRILTKLDELRTSGQVRTGGKEGIWV